MLLFADLHLDETSADDVLGQVLPGIYDLSVELRDPVIACLGDFWNLRYKVDVALQNAVRDELLRWTADGRQFLLLPGNHDQVDVAGRNALEVFDALGPDCAVFTQPRWMEHGLWVPYRKRPQDVLEALALPRPSYAKKVVFAHLGIQGAEMNPKVFDTEGFEPGFLKPFDAVLTGHYHRHQRLGNVIYVGSPRQVTALESGQIKGVVSWDGETARFIPCEWGKRYHRIRLEEGQTLQTGMVRPGDDVRVSAAAGIDVQAVGRQLAALGVQHAVTPDEEVVEARLQVSSDATLDDYFRGYVELTAGDLDKHEIMRAFQELHR